MITLYLGLYGATVVLFHIISVVHLWLGCTGRQVAFVARWPPSANCRNSWLSASEYANLQRRFGLSA